MAYYDAFYDGHFVEEEPEYLYEIETPFSVPEYFPQERWLDSVHVRMALILLAVLLIVPMLAYVRPKLATAGGPMAAVATVVAAVEAPAVEAQVAPVSSVQGSLAPVFSPEVKHWEPQILAWSAQLGLDPNLAAIIMQIESCGDPQAVSGSGAQGLFQVMPFHFAAGEDSLNPDTNAQRGLNYFVERLAQTNGDIGRAFAGYNGGHVAAAGSWDDWADETQRYYVWATGIYNDIQQGVTDSPTLQQWMEAGGASLCRQAAGRLGI
jgi:soluble lytic murein transglycosylase-like protein